MLISVSDFKQIAFIYNDTGAIIAILQSYHINEVIPSWN